MFGKKLDNNAFCFGSLAAFDRFKLKEFHESHYTNSMAGTIVKLKNENDRNSRFVQRTSPWRLY